MIITGLSDINAHNIDWWSGMGSSFLYYSIFIDHKSHGDRVR